MTGPYASREEVERTGHAAICAPQMEDRPGCEHHGHVQGASLEQPRAEYHSGPAYAPNRADRRAASKRKRP